MVCCVYEGSRERVGTQHSVEWDVSIVGHCGQPICYDRYKKYFSVVLEVTETYDKLNRKQ